jgi:hypothetical protein
MAELSVLSSSALSKIRGGITTNARAVLFIGKCLSYRDTPSSIAVLRSSILNTDTDWEKIADVANRNGVTAALWLALNRKNLAQHLPPDLRDYLMLIYDYNRRRNGLILDQAREATTALNGQDIRPIFMKGCLTLLDKGSDIGSSMMTDIDLIVREDEFAEAVSALRSLGYQLLGEIPAHAHARTFHRPMTLVTIDLHCHVGPQLKLLPTTAASQAAIAIASDLGAIEGLCMTHRVLLMIMTFGIFERHYLSGHIPLNNFHKLATLCRHGGDKVDWRYIADTVAAHGFAAECSAWGYMAHRLLEVPVPAYLLRAGNPRQHLRRCLQQLSFPALDRIVRSRAALTWPFNRFRMDYRYNCGTSGGALLTTRIRHLTSILMRRGCSLSRRYSLEFRQTCQMSDST